MVRQRKFNAYPRKRITQPNEDFTVLKSTVLNATDSLAQTCVSLRIHNKSEPLMDFIV